ncbi:ATP-binding protein [Geomicrobium sp. JCM 19038]|uniref:ATP-binding protein n=1 Tax=Geomicrobium sp. JCM 19038 TaxID=1460635 RepID=UPI00045F49C3|nr:ATP-binding protein [Geomicrobium sp. JCM 19038]GAK07761.1 two-component sensor histidine kinase [Geomicrobium sp. JCM 19038]
MFRTKKLPLQFRVMIYAMAMLFGTILLGGIFVAFSQAQQARQSLEDQVLLSASHLAESPMVVEALQADYADESLRTMLQKLRVENDLLYIVVVDMTATRLTHPNPSEIGELFVGDDISDVLENGHTYTSEFEGTLGPSLRAFTPIYNHIDEQIGAVSVGISTDRVDAYVSDHLSSLFISIGISLMIGTIGSFLLAKRIKQTLYGMEPEDIAHRLKEREAMLSSVQEGVIATDQSGMIIVANASAKATFHSNLIGLSIYDAWPDLPIQQQLEHQQMAKDELHRYQSTEMITNRIPVIVNESTVGTLVTFRDKSELDHLLERLAGVENYAQQLRMQTHEFMNKLHIIGAMVYTESYGELEEYIETLSTSYQAGVNEVGKYVKDVTLASYLSNQLERLHQSGVHITVTGEGTWPELHYSSQLDTWITVIGNALNNAYDAINQQTNREITLRFSTENTNLVLEISDNGNGFTNEQLSTFKQQGFSTKGLDRGFGLTIMLNAIAIANGTYEFDSLVGKGTTLNVKIPYKKKED